MAQLRLPYYELAAASMKHLRDLNAQLAKSSLGKPLIDLVYLRVSQINGCAYCLQLHARDARKGGETQERLDALAGWRVSGLFTARERAALEWAESLTHIAQTHAPDQVYEPLKEYFTDAQIADLTLAISLMNALNRLAVAMRQ